MSEDWTSISEDDDSFDEEGDEDAVFDSTILLEPFLSASCNLACLILEPVGIRRELLLLSIVCQKS